VSVHILRNFGIRNNLLYLPTRFDRWSILPRELILTPSARARNKGERRNISSIEDAISNARLCHDIETLQI